MEHLRWVLLFFSTTSFKNVSNNCYILIEIDMTDFTWQLLAIEYKNLHNFLNFKNYKSTCLCSSCFQFSFEFSILHLQLRDISQ